MPAPRVFHPLLARIGLVAIAPAGVALWAFGLVAATGVGAGLVALELWRVRHAVLRGTPAEVDFVPTSPTDHPWIDGEAFKHELQQLEELGFHAIADYAVIYPGAPRGFARVLIHPAQRVYAEVNQVKQGRTPLPVATTFESALTDGWSVQSTTREPMPVAYAFMRSPKAIWRSRPGAELPELLGDHLELRHRVCRDLGVRPSGEGTVDGYFAVQRENHRRRATAVCETNVVTGIARGLRCERSARREWLGDYAAAARPLGVER